VKTYSHNDLNRLVGAEVEIHKSGQLIFSGVVDAVMPDLAMLWLAADGPETRRLFELTEGFEVRRACKGLADESQETNNSREGALSARDE